MYIDESPVFNRFFSIGLVLAKGACFCSSFSTHCTSPMYLGVMFFAACLYIYYYYVILSIPIKKNDNI